MKTTYDEKTLQVITDEAFQGSDLTSLECGKYSRHWIQESPARLPEPTPPAVEADPYADPYAELKAAHAAGKVIELKPQGCPWEETDSPDWTAPLKCYRINPEPATFEAHGKTWKRHTPGDPMPCDGGAKIITLFKNGHQSGVEEALYWSWGPCYDAQGWRYADEPTPAQPWQPAVGDVVRLKSGGPRMTVTHSDAKSVIAAWFESNEVTTMGWPTECLIPAKEAHPNEVYQRATRHDAA